MKKLKRQVTLNNSMSVEGNTKKFNIADESESTHSNEKNEELHANSGGKRENTDVSSCVVTQSKEHRGILRYLIIEAAVVDISSVLFIIFRHILENFWPSLCNFLYDGGHGARAFLANVPAWCGAIFVGYILYDKLFEFAGEIRYKLRNYFVALSFLGAVLHSLFLLTAVYLWEFSLFPAYLIGIFVSIVPLFAGIPWLSCRKIIKCSDNSKKNVISEKSKNDGKLFSRISSLIFVRFPGYKKLKNSYIKTLFRVAGFLSMIILPAFCLYFLEYLHYYNTDGFSVYLELRGVLIAFALTSVYLIYLILLLIFKRAWISSLIFALLFEVIGIVNYFKYALTGDNLYPWDLIEQSGNVGELLGFVDIRIPRAAVIMLAVTVIFIIMIAFSKITVPVRFWIRIPAAAILLLPVILSMTVESYTNKALLAADLRLEDAFLQSSNYDYNGFFGGFYVNLLSMHVIKPESYSKETVEELISDYEYIPADENFSYPDIILILSESFWDPRNLPETTFSDNPLKNFDEITSREGTVSGYIYQTAMGGGTVRTEFDILTGLTTDYLPSGSTPWQYVRGSLPTFVSLYKNLGYDSFAVHPYLSAFYRRDTTYPLIGFDKTYFSDEIMELNDSGELLVTGSGYQISDDSFIDCITYYIDSADEESSVFAFGISMENHQPYEMKYSEEERTIIVENDRIDEETMSSVRNFTQGAANADAALGKLVEYIDSREKNTVLVYFGDHLPTLGVDFAAYVQSGYFSDPMTSEDILKRQRTPFLIYANFELSESSIVHAGKDNELSSYNLMNAASQLIGAPRTAYMEYLSDFYDNIPFYNLRLGLDLTDKQAYFVNAHRIFTYDLLCGGKYLISDE